MAEGGGVNLGEARGSIIIDVSNVENARRIVKKMATDLGHDFDIVDKKTQQAEAQLRQVGAAATQAQSGFGGLGNSLRQVAGGLGITLGAAGVVQIGKSIVASSQLATAYNRQQVAAVQLAGSQSKLNELMQAYDEATGGALDDATQLANVLSLQATGFGKSAEQLDRFARAARGISIATGRDQGSTIQQLQFELSNQTGFRLDQLGLSMVAVRQRAEELRAANASLTKEQAYQNAVLDEANAKYGKLIESVEGQATGLEKLAASWNNLGLAIGDASSGPINAFGQGASLLIDTQIARLRAWMNEIDIYIKLLRSVGMAGPWLTSGESSFVSSSAGRDIARKRGGSGVDTAPDLTERNEAITQWAKDVAAIERQAANDRLDAVRQFQSQQASTIRQYNLSTSREAEDFARGRQRQEQEFAKAIADIREDAARSEIRMAEDLARTIGRARADSAERLADMQEDLDRTISQRRADSAERIAEWEADRDEAIADRRRDSTARLVEIEQDFNKQRERSQRDSRDRIMDAAARLDARAVYEEQRRFARESEDQLAARDEQVANEKSKLQEAVDNLNQAHQERLADEQKALDKSIRQAQEAHARQVADEKEALDKRIADANAAYQQQLADARAADAQRIEDMKADFEQRKLEEDADRAIRLARLEVDHNNQLAEQERAHGERIAQIDRHATAERTALDDKFKTALNELGIRTDTWIAENQKITDEAIKQFDKWWEHITGKTIIQSPTTGPGTNPALNPRRDQLQGELDKLYKESAQYPINSPQHTDLRRRIELLEQELAKLGAGTAGTSSTSLATLAGTSRYVMPQVNASVANTGTGGRSFSIGQLSQTLVFGDIGNRTNGDIKRIVAEAMLELEIQIARVE